MVASTGRAGSTLLAATAYKHLPYRVILKSHILPPHKSFKGKILFIFSNPDLAAESALHITLTSAEFGFLHFKHMESSDQQWLNLIGDTANQTITDNLLTYDALGCYQQLCHWLHLNTSPCKLHQAQILAIKYENLWDKRCVREIKRFLSCPKLKIPPKKARGQPKELKTEQEIQFINTYNQGTSSLPKYTAYNQARMLWEQAPPFQYLRITN